MVPFNHFNGASVTIAAQFVIELRFDGVNKKTKIDFNALERIIAGAVVHLRNTGVLQSCCEPPTAVDIGLVKYETTYPYPNERVSSM